MLERRREAGLVPSYSMTGDLLSFLRCGLQYRYQNGSALPPSRPVQLWFGEFIHGVMETAYRTWLEARPGFPWPCTKTEYRSEPPAGRAPYDIGTIGDLVEATLHAAGKSPRSAVLRDSAYVRATCAVNEVGPHLFPLIQSAEEKVIGTRPLPGPHQPGQRAQMYELHGVMDVLSSVSLEAAVDNVICTAVREVIPNVPVDSEIIVDYKGSRRPPTTHPFWQQGDRQLQTYAWLRSRQPGARRVVAGVLLYINELAPGRSDAAALLREAQNNATDVVPANGTPDYYQLQTWTPAHALPNFSREFRLRRMIRVVPITQPSIDSALAAFDNVVVDIESCVARETERGKIIGQWEPRGEEQTCSACDFRHFCPSPADTRGGGPYTPPAPSAP